MSNNNSQTKNLPSQLYAAFSPEPDTVVEFVRWLAKSYRLGKNLRILDVGCGPGKMLPKYAELGWQVVGLEIDKDFYKQADQLARTLEGVEAQKGGFNDINQRNAFNLITAINGPFAYLLEPKVQEDALQRAYRALKPGGLLFVDIPNLLWFLKNDPKPAQVKKSVAGRKVKHKAHYEYDVHEATFKQLNEYTIEEPNGHKTTLQKIDRHAIITYPELVYLLESCGFTKLRSYNSFSVRRSSPIEGKRIMVAAQKPPK